jgi:hypothetical protein
MREEIVKCDVCKKVKGEGNKWLTVRVGDDPPFITLAGTLSQDGLGITKDVCSEACLQIEIGKVLEKIRNG